MDYKEITDLIEKENRDFEQNHKNIFVYSRIDESIYGIVLFTTVPCQKTPVITILKPNEQIGWIHLILKTLDFLCSSEIVEMHRNELHRLFKDFEEKQK